MPGDDKRADTKFETLQKYTTDLTEQARKGELDPVVGREEEIRRVLAELRVGPGPETSRPAYSYRQH